LGRRVRDFLVDRRVRLSVVICLLVVGLNLALGQLPHAFYNYRDPVAIMGLLSLVAGLALRSWAAGILLKGKALTTIGPYGMCRHPLYLGTTLIVTGIAIIFPGFINSLPALAALALIFGLTIRREEQRMANKYGTAWDAYAARTPRIVPRLPETFLQGWSVAQWRRSREYNALLAATALLISFAVWSELVR